MLHYRRVQREDQEIVQITCNKCGKVYPKTEQHPDFTTIKNTYGYGSTKDGDKYVSHVCEPCMDAFYESFAVPPQVVGMIEWGYEPPDPVRYLGEPDPPVFDPADADTTTTPVAPVVVEEHASQEEATQEG